MSDFKAAEPFKGKNQNNQDISLDDFKGKRVILYFYPKDDTPGCTREAIAFSEFKTEFESLNTHIIGVSKDSVSSHQKFCEKHNLTIDLISDPDLEILNQYGVWQEKKNYGKTYMGIVRSTFLINENAQIVKEWRNVRVNGHVEAVLNSVKEL